jgi:hypothetical protein
MTLNDPNPARSALTCFWRPARVLTTSVPFCHKNHTGVAFGAPRPSTMQSVPVTASVKIRSALVDNRNCFGSFAFSFTFTPSRASHFDALECVTTMTCERLNKS